MKSLLCLSLLCATAALGQQAMTATFVEGTVTAQLADGSSARPLAQGDVLHVGDTIATNSDSRVEMALPDGSVLRFGENTRVTLRNYVPHKAFSARLLVGNLWAKVEKLIGAQTFEIETENGVAGVRGTEFRLESARGRDDLVRVYDGAVQAASKDGAWSHRIEPGNELRFRRGVAPAGPRRFDPASERNHKFMNWVRSRPTRVGAQPGEIHRAPAKPPRKNFLPGQRHAPRPSSRKTAPPEKKEPKKKHRR
jgi:ferric-dicitrate binding protein FerR (iron transport regulator)